MYKCLDYEWVGQMYMYFYEKFDFERQKTFYEEVYN